MKINRILWQVVLTIIYCQSLQAQPCLSGFNYRVPIILDNSNSGTTTGAQLQLIIDTKALISAGKMKSNGADLRFLDAQGDTLPFAIENGTLNTKATEIWLRKPTVRGYSKDTIYMYYGNSSALAKENPQQVFDVYEDFSKASFYNLWDTCGSGSLYFQNGQLTMKSRSGVFLLKSKNLGVPSGQLEVEFKAGNKGEPILAQINQSGDGYAMVQNGSTLYYASNLSSSSCINTSNLAQVSNSVKYGTWTLAWPKNGVQNFSHNGQSKSLSNSIYQVSSNQKLMIGVRSSTDSLHITRIRFKRAHSITTTIGIEQTTNYQIKPSYKKPLCENGDLELLVDDVVGAIYSWTGPNGFTSTMQNPVITGVQSSDAGLYIVNVELPKGCASRNSSVNVTVAPSAKGRQLTGSQTVCSGQNYGLLSLKNQVGNVERWDSSHDGTKWFPIATTALTRTYRNLTQNTFYRVLVENGACSMDTSQSGRITVTDSSLGGKVVANDSLCYGNNSGLLSLTNYRGNVVQWEYSLNGNLWKSLVNRNAIQNYSNLTQTTHYRAVVKYGICAEKRSEPAKLTVLPKPEGGQINGGGQACSGKNRTVLKAQGYVGTIRHWESATDLAGPWSSINNSMDSLVVLNLAQTTHYRVVVQVDSCQVDESSIATIQIVNPASAGTLSGANRVCAGFNSGSVVLKDYTGVINYWLSKDSSNPWKKIPRSLDFLNYSNLETSMTYAAVLGNGSCPADTSNEVLIKVDQTSTAGSVISNAPVCKGNNKVQLELKGQTGIITAWERSENGYSNWKKLTDTTAIIYLSNLNESTFVRAKVKNGTCPHASAAAHHVIVNNHPVGGGFENDISACKSENYGILSLKGYSGNILSWQSSSDSLANWVNIPNSQAFMQYKDLDTSTYYRVIVGRDGCANDSSFLGRVLVDLPSEGGKISGMVKHCNSTNNGVLKLRNYLGDIQRWETSSNGGQSWEIIESNLDSLEYESLKMSAIYRAKVRNGSCQSTYSDAVQIDVYAASVAGSISSGKSALCAGNNFTPLNLNGFVGNHFEWERKALSENTWNKVPSTTSSHWVEGLGESSEYRTIVQNESCPADTSKTYLLKVHPSIEHGDLKASRDTICQGSDIQVVAKNYVGKIEAWETRSPFGSWKSLDVNSDTLTLLNLDQSIDVRVLLSSGHCFSEQSPAIAIKVLDKIDAGHLTIKDTVCAGLNDGVLRLQDAQAENVFWESKELGQNVWTLAQQDGRELEYHNLDRPTEYRIIAQSSCGSDTNYAGVVHVYASPKSSFQVDGACEMSTSRFINQSTTDSGHIESLRWKINSLNSGNTDTLPHRFYRPGLNAISLEAVNSFGCKSISSQEIDIHPTPKVQFVLNGALGNAMGCTNQVIEGVNYTSIQTNDSLTYKWVMGNRLLSEGKNAAIKVDKGGRYPVTLYARSAKGCLDSLTQYVLIEDAPTIFAGDDRTEKNNKPFFMEAKGAQIYEWSPPELFNNPASAKTICRLKESTMVYVKGTDIRGCSGYDTVFISIKGQADLIPSNVVTTNGNGSNETWVIENIEKYPDHEVKIFNRWGKEVYSSTSYANDWPANRPDEKELLDGTYYYMINVGNGQQIFKGALTLIQK